MPEHTIAENLTRLQNAKTAIGTAITAKGGTVAAGDGLEEFAADIATIDVTSGSDFVSVTNFDYGTDYKTLIKSVAIPEGVTTISANSFNGCSNLEHLYLPNSLLTINSRAFEACRKLQNFIFPNGLTTLGYRAFNDCQALTYVELPSSITSIDSQAFYRCTNIATIRIHKTQGSISGAPWGATNANVIWDD